MISAEIIYAIMHNIFKVGCGLLQTDRDFTCYFIYMNETLPPNKTFL